MIQRLKEREFVFWNYNRLWVTGIEGGLEITLEEMGKNCRGGSLDFAPVKKEGYRDFLAGFYFEPPIDVTVVKGKGEGEGLSSIVTYSLNKNKSKEIIEELIKQSGFISQEPRKEFIEQISREIAIEKRTYEQGIKIVGALGADFEKVFGMIHYGNFLKYYGFSEQEVIKRAAERFGIQYDF